MSTSTGKIDLDAEGLIRELKRIAKAANEIEGSIDTDMIARGLDRTSGSAVKYQLRVKALNEAIQSTAGSASLLASALSDPSATHGRLDTETTKAERLMSKLKDLRSSVALINKVGTETTDGTSAPTNLSTKEEADARVRIQSEADAKILENRRSINKKMVELARKSSDSIRKVHEENERARNAAFLRDEPQGMLKLHRSRDGDIQTGDQYKVTKKREDAEDEQQAKIDERIARAEAGFKRNFALQKKANAALAELDRNQLDDSKRLSRKEYKERLSVAKAGIKRLISAEKERVTLLKSLYKEKVAITGQQKANAEVRRATLDSIGIVRDAVTSMESVGRKFGLAVGDGVKSGVKTSMARALSETKSALEGEKKLLSKHRREMARFDDAFRESKGTRGAAGLGDRSSSVSDIESLRAKRTMGQISPKGIADQLALPDLSGHLKKVRRLRGAIVKMGRGGLKAVNSLSFGYWKMGQAVSQTAMIITNIKDAALEGEQIRNVGMAFDHIASKSGVSMDRLREATDGAMGTAALQKLAVFGTSAKLQGDVIEAFAKKARGAAMVNGKTIDENFRRLVQGTAKQEKEVLDEMSIIVDNATKVWSEAAKRLGKSVNDLTPEDKVEAYSRAVMKASAHLDDYADKYKGINKIAGAQALLTDAINDTKVAFAEIAEDSGMFEAMGSGVDKITELMSTDFAKSTILTVMDGISSVLEGVTHWGGLAAVTIGTLVGPALKLFGGLLKASAKAAGPLVFVLVQLTKAALIPLLAALGGVSKALGVLFGWLPGIGDGLDQLGDSFLDASVDIIDSFEPAINDSSLAVEGLYSSLDRLIAKSGDATLATTSLSLELIKSREASDRAAAGYKNAAEAAEEHARRTANAKKFLLGDKATQSDIDMKGLEDVKYQRDQAVRDAEVAKSILDDTASGGEFDDSFRPDLSTKRGVDQDNLLKKLKARRDGWTGAITGYEIDRKLISEVVFASEKSTKELDRLSGEIGDSMVSFEVQLKKTKDSERGMKSKVKAFANQRVDIWQIINQSLDPELMRKAAKNARAGVRFNVDDATTEESMKSVVDPLSIDSATGEIGKGKTKSNIRELKRIIQLKGDEIDRHWKAVDELRTTDAGKMAELGRAFTGDKDLSAEDATAVYGQMILQQEEQVIVLEQRRRQLEKIENELSARLKGSGRKKKGKKEKLILPGLLFVAEENMAQLKSDADSNTRTASDFLKKMSSDQAGVIIAGAKENIDLYRDDLKSIQDQYLGASRELINLMDTSNSVEQFNRYATQYTGIQESIKSIKKWFPDPSHVSASDHAGKAAVKLFRDQNKYVMKIRDEADALRDETEKILEIVENIDASRQRAKEYDEEWSSDMMFMTSGVEENAKFVPQVMLDKAYNAEYYEKLKEIEDRRTEIMEDAERKRSEIRKAFAEAQGGPGARFEKDEALKQVNEWEATSMMASENESQNLMEDTFRGVTKEFMEKQETIITTAGTSIGSGFGTSIGTSLGESLAISLNDVYAETKDWKDNMGELFGSLFANLGGAIAELASAEIMLYTGNPVGAALAAGAIMGFSSALGGLFARKKGDNKVEKFAREELKRNKEKKEQQYSVTIVHQGLTMNRRSAEDLGVVLEAALRSGVRIRT